MVAVVVVTKGVLPCVAAHAEMAKRTPLAALMPSPDGYQNRSWSSNVES
jgi:hypothetical protein